MPPRVRVTEQLFPFWKLFHTLLERQTSPVRRLLTVFRVHRRRDLLTSHAAWLSPCRVHLTSPDFFTAMLFPSIQKCIVPPYRQNLPRKKLQMTSAFWSQAVRRDSVTSTPRVRSGTELLHLRSMLHEHPKAAKRERLAPRILSPWPSRDRGPLRFCG